MTDDLPASSQGAPPVSVQVWGPGALFTRPELKVERVTYPVMTPTAAIGVLEAIFWKPEFTWRPVAIDVLKPISQFTQRRNETTGLVSLENAAQNGATVDAPGNRTQRNSVCLRDVAYRIYAHVDLREHATKSEAAYRDQFRRRVERGQCFHQPYLGTREFSAFFGPVDDVEPQRITEDLGIMLHSVHHRAKSVSFSWFTARLEGGRLHIPRTGITSGEGAGV
ncbi:CRISPR-associated Cas5d family protein [Halopolyspora algeriensis]|uniref:pre-crRNA processing endonuclease n=1 Tax=Halopolyspora algeriensis TaxID=1500506 RepID=A0A368VV10_9ACTN|nr:type I-C CRISPR-associated protein Cas5c [Halopolyspora algeriensis]RCW45126.1 CRISPR-associated Cas5d family protein [Halopolyspora algeriensis]TQM53152.1 CRISPR-associated Cas5d family protein [Halopolyspora algeriensis]